MMKFIYKSPLARLLDSSGDGAESLVWFAEGTPGVTWQSGEYYDPDRRPPRRPNPQQSDGALIDAFWNESMPRVGLHA